jgi:hypothetical protein
MENLTESERQLIECLREAADFKEWRLVVGYDELDGWEIALSCDGKKGRGLGKTFAATWDDITGLFMDNPR